MTPENWRFSNAADEAAMEGIALDAAVANFRCRR